VRDTDRLLECFIAKGGPIGLRFHLLSIPHRRGKKDPYNGDRKGKKMKKDDEKGDTAYGSLIEVFACDFKYIKGGTVENPWAF